MRTFWWKGFVLVKILWGHLVERWITTSCTQTVTARLGHHSFIHDICNLFSTDKIRAQFSPHGKCVNRVKTSFTTKKDQIAAKRILGQNYTNSIKKDLKVKQCEL